jgi:hypothetical protein
MVTKAFFCFLYNCFACGGNTFFETFSWKGLVLTSEHRYLSGTVLNQMPSKIKPTFINRYKAFKMMQSNCAFKSCQCTCSSAILKYFSVIIYYLLPETPCSDSPCFNDGSCFISGSSYSCSCFLGFTGSRCQGMITALCHIILSDN